MSFVIYFLLSACIFIFSGLGLSLLILPEKLRKYAFHLSPILGYCYLTLAGWHLSTLGQQAVFNSKGKISSINSVSIVNLHGTDSFAWYLLIPPIIFIVAALIRLNKSGAASFGGAFKGVAVPLAIASVSFLLISTPLISRKDSLTSFSVTNHDIIDSGLKARYLKEFSMSDTVGYLSYINDDYNFLKHDVFTNRFGSPFAAAYLASVFSLEAYRFQTMVTHLFFFFSVMIFYATAREIFKYGGYSAAVLTAVYGLSPTMIYLAYHGFQPQIVAMSVVASFFLLHFCAVRNAVTFREYAPYILAAGLVNWGISITYAHMFPIIYTPLLAYVFFRSLKQAKGRMSALGSWALFQAAVLALTVVFSLARTEAIIDNLRMHAMLEAGWDMPYFSPDYIAGLTFVDISPSLWIHGYRNEFKPILALISENSGFLMLVQVALSIGIIGLVMSGLYRRYKDDFELFALSACIVVVLLGGANYIYFTTPVSASYKSFKLISFFLPLILMAAFMLFKDVSFNIRKALTYPLLLVLISNAVAASIFIKHPYERRFVERDLAEIKAIEEMPEVDSVNILGYYWWDLMWENVFLMKKEQHFEISMYAGREASPLNGQWDLIASSPAQGDSACKDVVQVTPAFVLKKAKHLPNNAYRASLSWAGNAEDPQTIRVRITNASEVEWDMECASRKLVLSQTVHYLTPDGQVYSYGGRPTVLPQLNLKQGEHMEVEAKVVIREPGKHSIEFDLREEGSMPFSLWGSKKLNLYVN